MNRRDRKKPERATKPRPFYGIWIVGTRQNPNDRRSPGDVGAEWVGLAGTILGKPDAYLPNPRCYKVEAGWRRRIESVAFPARIALWFTRAKAGAEAAAGEAFFLAKSGGPVHGWQRVRLYFGPRQGLVVLNREPIL